jgi:hypothetical protein
VVLPIVGEAVAKSLRLMVEKGPKGKKVVAVAPDWPGLARGAKTKEEAIERLRAYIPRYAPVAKLADMSAQFDSIRKLHVVEQYEGTPSTDFWGISFAFSKIDKQAVPARELERELALMQACWAFVDSVRARVSAKMLEGKRGGGRDREQIVRHLFVNEQQWAKKLGVITPDEAMLSKEGMKTHRDAYCRAIREYHSQRMMAGKVAKWPLRYLIRHTAFHTMDHAWEMEDKDLTPHERVLRTRS